MDQNISKFRTLTKFNFSPLGRHVLEVRQKIGPT